MTDNNFKPHLPSYMSWEPEPSVTFNGFEELIKLPQPSRFMSGDDFVRFGQTPYLDKYLLRVELKNGETWVVGYMDHPVPELPHWQEPETNKTSHPYMNINFKPIDEIPVNEREGLLVIGGLESSGLKERSYDVHCVWRDIDGRFYVGRSCEVEIIEPTHWAKAVIEDQE